PPFYSSPPIFEDKREATINLLFEWPPTFSPETPSPAPYDETDSVPFFVATSERGQAPSVVLLLLHIGVIEGIRHPFCVRLLSLYLNIQFYIGLSVTLLLAQQSNQKRAPR
ncbi:hypothetical protein MNBD_GAMMA03-122, partial [hydrothermal vent metagenome]